MYLKKTLLKKNMDKVYAELKSSIATIEGQSQIITVARDISERKALEEELKTRLALEETKTSLFVDSPVAMVFGGADGSIISANGAFEELVGYKEEELVEIGWLEVLTPKKWWITEEQLIEKSTRKKRGHHF